MSMVLNWVIVLLFFFFRVNISDIRRIKGNKLVRSSPITIDNASFASFYKKLADAKIVPPINEHDSMNIESFGMITDPFPLYSGKIIFERLQANLFS